MRVTTREDSPGVVHILGDKYHLVFMENLIGELTVLARSGKLSFRALTQNSATIVVEPHQPRHPK